MTKQYSHTMIIAAALTIALMGGAPAMAQQGAGAAVLPDPQRMARIEASVDRALEYLLQTQNADGSWPSRFGSNNGINALCLLAFMGRGHVPERGPYRLVVDRAVRYLAATQQESGLYRSPNPSHGPMYEHGLSTLAMIEAYGFLPTLEMRDSVQRAVDLIVKSQNPEGGWRYQPVPADADLSVTVMQVVALRAAVNAKLNVPQQTLDKALQYTRACMVADGGFAYQPGGGPQSARTAAGLLCMYLLGAFDDEGVEKSFEWLSKRPHKESTAHFWYLNYYGMQAHYQAGGQRWLDWQRSTTPFLLEKQNADGSWPGFADERYNSEERCYSTAMGAMSLTVYMHYLPAYQR